MNIWISRRLAVALTSTLLLAACVAAPEGKKPRMGLTRAAPETVSVARGAIVVGGPQGFCVDKGGSRLRGDTAFVLLASCYAITQNPEAAAPFVQAILTASVAGQTDAAPATEPALDQLDRFITSPDGRATLARDGQADSVEILEARRVASAVLVRLQDSSTNPTPGLEQTYWRGFFDLNGRLITISVIGFASQPLHAEDALALLRGFLARIRSETLSATAQEVPTQAPKPPKRLFGGLFN